MAIETGFLVSLLFKKVRGKGSGGRACLILWPGGGRLFGGGRLLERGRLFEEIR